jgi:hypothetical protein
MNDSDILETVNRLAAEEHDLETKAGRTALSEWERARLHKIEDGLGQCWDLLRQRRVRRAAGLSPDEAEVRDVNTVEHYQQ